MILALLLLWAGHSLLDWISIITTNVQYGSPRIFQVDHFVGHEADSHTPTHFVAINEQGQVYVWELPGANAAASHVIVGPRLSGLGADQVPVTLSFTGDPHHPDLLIEVGNLQVRFHNTGTTYAPT
jgi:hypothetical protein